MRWTASWVIADHASRLDGATARRPPQFGGGASISTGCSLGTVRGKRPTINPKVFFGSVSMAEHIIGADIKARREALGLTQRAVAASAGLHHRSIHYWEGSHHVDPRAHGPSRILAVLGWRISEHHTGTHARARHGVLSPDDCVSIATDVLGVMSERLARRIFLRRVQCGAKTRAGTPCRAKSEPGRRRCRLHGGLSTGPKTESGRLRIAEAQRARHRQARTCAATKGDQKGD